MKLEVTPKTIIEEVKMSIVKNYNNYDLQSD